jgi:putative molybdopterin biosynthesis protein
MAETESYLYQEIAEALRRQIAAGELQAGDRLPSVREQAERWGCNPGTVSRAYSTLAEEGLVEGHRGSGTRVTRNALQPQEPTWQWASLVHRAEQFLLEALGSGHDTSQAQAALSVAVARWEALQAGEAARAAVGTDEPETKRLRFAGSHDLTIGVIERMLGDVVPPVVLEVAYVGSLGGLMALARGEADMAGTHLWDERTDSYNRPFVRRLFPGETVALLTVAHRRLGLITPADNPQQLAGVADLVRPEVRFVNRQSGSGTRVWLDARLKEAGLAPGAIPGYEREESTHMAVAQAVDQEEATAGIGIFAAAAAYGLGFVELARERYDLALPERMWETARGRAVRKVVASPDFREAVAALGGYEMAETGRVEWV